jgi:hypothetical protein
VLVAGVRGWGVGWGVEEDKNKEEINKKKKLIKINKHSL